MGIKNFQKVIGYQFSDEKLLRTALTHSSYANEKHLKKGSYNEKLEFLGDAVLELVSSEFLYLNYPDLKEGELSKFRASIVCEPTLALCAQEISLGDYLYLSKGEDMNGGRHRDSIVSDAMEAVIGAIFLDGGLTNAKEFILKYILTDVEKKKLFYDSKTILQEILQSDHEKLTYELIEESGPAHHPHYKSRALIDGREISTGEGTTKKAAEQEAAYKAILLLKNK